MVPPSIASSCLAAACLHPNAQRLRCHVRRRLHATCAAGCSARDACVTGAGSAGAGGRRCWRLHLRAPGWVHTRAKPPHDGPRGAGGAGGGNWDCEPPCAAASPAGTISKLPTSNGGTSWECREHVLVHARGPEPRLRARGHQRANARAWLWLWLAARRLAADSKGGRHGRHGRPRRGRTRGQARAAAHIAACAAPAGKPELRLPVRCGPAAIDLS